LIGSFVNEKIEEAESAKKLKKIQLAEQLTDPTFSLTSLLKQHKIFEKSADKILPKTNLLSTHYLADSRKIISFSLIINKIYQSFLDIQKMFEISKIATTNTRPQTNNQMLPPLNETLNGLIDILKKFESLCESMFKEIPGLTELPIDYQALIIKRNLIDLFIVLNVDYYENGEMRIYTEDGQHITRELLERLRGKLKTNLLYESIDYLHNLKITNREKAILIAFIFTFPGKS
jgi:hypothetical protein